MTKKEIKTFLETFGTRVTECSQDVELMMDDHRCIKWGGIEYYIPENDSFYTDLENEICEYLYINHHV